MNIQDSNTVRTAADLERKYNFGKLLGLEKNIESNSGALIKVNNQLNNMLNSLIINLGDVLDSQTDISLWFYTGVPTTSNVPYTNWTTPADHIGDLYYNQSTGYVYKYTSTGWAIQEDQNLISALALTNADIDTQTDHERKVYFTQPIPAYSSGDWWILEDGTLKICQLGKGATDEYDSQDFVVSSKYTSTVATKQGDTITVFQGTVTEITENYVKYTDLGSGGSTTISGDKIKSGAISSNNYETSNNNAIAGMKIDLDNGVIDSKNLKLKNNGDLSISGYIETDKGILTHLQYKSENGFLGQPEKINSGMSISRGYLYIYANIPQGFEVVKATISLNCLKTYNYFYSDVTEGSADACAYGKVKNINLYKPLSDISMIYDPYVFVGYDPNADVDSNFTVISNVFGTNGYTATTDETRSETSADISNEFKTNGVTTPGNYIFCLRTADSKLSNTTIPSTLAAAQQTQYAFAVLNIVGHMPLNS